MTSLRSARERRIGVVVMAYGTPASYDDIEAFYLDIRRGKPPTPEQLSDLQRRYAAVGGTSQLAARTAEQVAGIAASLEEIAPGGYLCQYGAKHAEPTIEQAVDELVAEGVAGITAIVLAPHYSSGSTLEYLERVRARAGAAGLRSSAVEGWHTDPVFVDLLSERVRDAFASIGARPDDQSSTLLVTAHSLPVRVVESGDAYDARLAETAALVAKAAGAPRFEVCWQSAGRTPEPWIGPDVLDVLRDLPAGGTSSVVVCPAGFTSDHLEVNYDLDIEAEQLASRIGLRFARSASLNAEPRLCRALAALVAEAAADVST